MRGKLKASRMMLMVLLLMPSVLLSGCWSSNNIQEFLYATALGIDYDGKTFTAYVQFVDFENLSVAGAGTGKSLAGNYVGKGSGITLTEAVSGIYPTAQGKVEWGHMNAIVVSERALSALGSEITKRIYRFPENRYNIWFYVTKDPLDKVFEMSSMFNPTSLFTILHKPVDTFQQSSTIPPLLMFEYMSTFSEPDRIVSVPLIGINYDQWESDRGKQPMLMIKGAYFESPKKSITLSNEQLKGYMWLNPEMKRLMFVVKDEEQTYSTITIVNKKVKVKPYIENGQVKFNIKANYLALMNEYIEETSYEEMAKLAEQNIEGEIRKLFLLGVEEQIDLLNLMHYFRLKMPKQWKEMTDIGEEFILTENSIHNIEVKVKIVYNGKYKRRL